MAFGLKNGVANLSEMRARIAHYREDPSILDARQDPQIGCRIVTQPFFWSRDLWIPIPASWAPNIVSGKGYAAEHGDGLAIWTEVSVRRASLPGPGSLELAAAPYGVPVLIKPRLGQGAFRLSVTDNYERRCAVTGEKTLPILDAAHIKSFSAGGPHDPSNGLLLRTDIHRLFDLGYVTVSNDHRFEVSKRLKVDFDNGRHYYDLHGAPVRSPLEGLPSSETLVWHRQNRFLG